MVLFVLVLILGLICYINVYVGAVAIAIAAVGSLIGYAIVREGRDDEEPKHVRIDW